MRAFLVCNARALVGETYGVSPVQYGNARLAEVGVYKVFRNLADDRIGDGSSLLLSQIVCFCSYFAYVAADIRRFYVHDARGGEHIVVYGNARRLHAFGKTALFVFHAPSFPFQASCDKDYTTLTVFHDSVFHSISWKVGTNFSTKCEKVVVFHS